MLKTKKQLLNIINELKNFTEFSVWVLKSNKVKNNTEMNYKCFKINVEKKDIQNYLNTLSSYYNSDNSPIKNFNDDICDYSNSFTNQSIYKLETKSNFVNESYKKIQLELFNNDVESEVKHNGLNFSIIELKLDNKKIQLFLIMNPFKTLKKVNWFTWDKNKYRSGSETVLQLKQYIDLIVMDNTLILLDQNWEKVFNVEKEVTKQCKIILKEMKEELSEIVTDWYKFETVALSGHNQRKIILKDQNKITSLSNRLIQKKLNFDLDKNGKINTDNKEQCKKLIKYISNKLAKDILDDSIVETEGNFKKNV